MANKLITCESCPSMVLDVRVKEITTSKGKMRVCQKCYDSFSVEVSNSIIESPKKESPEVNAYLKQISPVTNPESVPHPVTKEKFTQAQLFAEYLNNAQKKIAEIFDTTKPDYDAGKAYKEMEERIQLYESIVFQAKTEASEFTKKKRELDAASGKNRWDKERRGENKTNLSDPRNSPLLSAAQKKHKTALSKAEANVKGLLDIGTEPDDIITMLTSTGKFKGSEIREAIEKFK